MDVDRYVHQIDHQLASVPAVRKGGSLLILVGLPGVGKSQLAESIASPMDAVVVSTDKVRRLLWPKPGYSATEVAKVYRICHGVVVNRLGRGQRVIFDASNYDAGRRQRLIRLAKRCKAITAICHVQASEETVRGRLDLRNSLRPFSEEPSDATWPVHQWMAAVMDPLAVPHLNLDTSAGSFDKLAKQLTEYWLACETASDGNANL